ncbi:MAG: HRDC domain-containing protein [Saprospiraceae bacterium]|nr:HRDC domain-containing protein [Lewinella sp.]
MPSTEVSYELLETLESLEIFHQTNKNTPWLAFDTEFVGEKRYYTLLCLIQVTTENGVYLIDPIKISNLDPFLQLIEDPNIVKITHAGDNDYRLLNTAFGTVPQNVFDTQVAAGFMGYRYPISFQNLVEGELNIRLNKGYAVADWESRPFQRRQLTYALDDVIPLHDLWVRISEKLKEDNRLHWVREELTTWETPEFYERDPHHELLSSNLVRSLKTKERIFLMRLLTWRREQAEEKDYSKEMILPGKLISHIVRGIASGKDALKKNRRIPDRYTDRYGKLFLQMYVDEVDESEKEVLGRLPSKRNGEINDNDKIVRDLLYLLIQHRAQTANVAPALVMPKNMLEKMKSDPDLKALIIDGGWRREMLGDTIVHWIENINELELDIEDGKIGLNVPKK